MTFSKSAALNIMQMVAPVHNLVSESACQSCADRTNLTRSLGDSPIHPYLTCQNH